MLFIRCIRARIFNLADNNIRTIEMKRKLLLASLLLSYGALFSQIGINTVSPAATLDITAKTSDGSKAEGIILPRLTGNQLKSGDASYTPAQKGTMVYVTAAVTGPTPKTVNINSEGYYYFDGEVWQKVINGNSDINIYSADGTLSGNRTVAMADKTLNFISTSTAGTSHFNVDGTTLNVDAVNHRIGVGTATPGNKLSVIGTGSDTGLQLTNGAGAGKVLTSDANGNGTWQPTTNVFVYSEVHGTGNNNITFTNNQLVNFFHTVKGENVKTVYGNSYGWNDASQRWIAPYTGKYRVTTNGYFNQYGQGGVVSSANPRLYGFKNGTAPINIVSIFMTGSTSDISSATSAIVNLNKGEYIEWRAWTGAGNVILYAGDYHTFIRVESVE